MTSGPTKAELEERVGELEQQLGELGPRAEEAEAKRDEYLADLQRLAADFDNYRKRVARDQEGLVARAHERLVKELIPVLDDLERALEAAAEHEEAKLEEGVRLVHRALAAALAREGLAEIEANGRFDPHVHEALLSQPSDADEGTVIDVLQKGYRLGDRVIRPARVVIAAPAVEPPVRDSGPGEGDGGNREVPPDTEGSNGDDA
jgi:molecular chaperone GrpE